MPNTEQDELVEAARRIDTSISAFDAVKVLAQLLAKEENGKLYEGYESGHKEKAERYIQAAAPLIERALLEEMRESPMIGGMKWRIDRFAKEKRNLDLSGEG